MISCYLLMKVMLLPQLRAMYNGDRSRKEKLVILAFACLLYWIIVHKHLKNLKELLVKLFMFLLPLPLMS